MTKTDNPRQWSWGDSCLRGGYLVLMQAVLLVVGGRDLGLVDGDLRKIGTAQAGELCIEVREQARLHEGIVGDIDAGNDIADTIGDLLGLGEKI